MISFVQIVSHDTSHLSKKPQGTGPNAQNHRSLVVQEIRHLLILGNDFDLTKERVRQIKEKALRKLRNETGSLFDYM